MRRIVGDLERLQDLAPLRQGQREQAVTAADRVGATHVGVTTDHVIEPFRNEMWPTYKSSAGMDPPRLGDLSARLEAPLVL